MTSDKVREMIGIYRQMFEELGINEKKDYPHDELFDDESTRPLHHCYGMLDQMEKFLDEGRLEKAFRWLGFIQGFLWHQGIYTLEELKNHNRPTVGGEHAVS